MNPSQLRKPCSVESHTHPHPLWWWKATLHEPTSQLRLCRGQSSKGKGNWTLDHKTSLGLLSCGSAGLSPLSSPPQPSTLYHTYKRSHIAPASGADPGLASAALGKQRVWSSQALAPGLLEGTEAIWPVCLPESLVMKGGPLPIRRMQGQHTISGCWTLTLSANPHCPQGQQQGFSQKAWEEAPAGAPGTEPWARSRLPREWGPEGHMPAGQDHSVLSSSPSHTCSNQKKMTIQEQPRQWRKTSGVLF